MDWLWTHSPCPRRIRAHGTRMRELVPTERVGTATLGMVPPTRIWRAAVETAAAVRMVAAVRTEAACMAAIVRMAPVGMAPAAVENGPARQYVLRKSSLVRIGALLLDRCCQMSGEKRGVVAFPRREVDADACLPSAVWSRQQVGQTGRGARQSASFLPSIGLLESNIAPPFRQAPSPRSPWEDSYP